MRIKNGKRIYEQGDIVILHKRPRDGTGRQCFNASMTFPRRGIVLAVHPPTVTLGLLSFRGHVVTMQQVVDHDSLQHCSDFISL